MNQKAIDTLTGAAGIAATEVAASVIPPDPTELVNLIVQVSIGLLTIAKLVFPRWFTKKAK